MTLVSWAVRVTTVPVLSRVFRVNRTIARHQRYAYGFTISLDVVGHNKLESAP